MVILCAKEIAVRLGVSERTATRLLKSGEIAGFRVGKLWRTTELHLESYVTGRFHCEREQHPAPPSSHDLSLTPPGVDRSESATPGLSVTNRTLPPHATLFGLTSKREPA